MQQIIPWAEVKKETVRWKSRWKIRDLLEDGQAVLYNLAASDAGSRELAEEDPGSEASDRELRERRGREDESQAEVTELGAEVGWGGATVVPTHALLHGIGGQGVGDE